MYNLYEEFDINSIKLTVGPNDVSTRKKLVGWQQGDGVKEFEITRRAQGPVVKEAAFALRRARQCLRSWTAARRSATARGVDQSLPHDENYAAARHQRGKWRHFLFRRWQ